MAKAFDIPREDARRENEFAGNTYTYSKDECMHSNTTGFVVNALATPHTQLKSQLRPIMVFPLQSTAGWAATRPVHCGHKDVSSTVIQRNLGGPTNLIIIITDQNLSGRRVQTRMNGNKKKSFSGSSKWSDPGRLKICYV
jgi:hypothetical protein